MSHLAFIAPPFPSHFEALQALAIALLERGHRVTFLQRADAARFLRDPRIGFHPLGERSHPPGSLQALIERAARPGGPLGLRRVIQDMAEGTAMLCREGPAALRELGVDGVIADEMEAAGGLLGEHLQVPWVSVACALPVNREARVPLPVMPWGYASTPRGEGLNRGSTGVYDRMMTPHAQVIEAAARNLGLPPRRALHECLSPLAQISQTIAAFDFPRLEAPAHYHAVGPLRPPQAEPPLQLPLDPARPFIFASLGTLQGGRFELFKRIARAARRCEAQLLLAHCGRLNTLQERVLERQGATWVTDFAPQRAALARADALITHAGLNTVMDALATATPMLALPIAFDQPGVAARVQHSGCGLRALPALLGSSGIAQRLQRLLQEPHFSERAAQLGVQLSQAGGAPRAADIVERALDSGRPVCADAC